MKLTLLKDLRRAYQDYLFFHEDYTLVYFSFKTKYPLTRYLPKRFLKIYFRNHKFIYRTICGFYFNFLKINTNNIIFNKFSNENLLFLIKGYKVYRASDFINILMFNGSFKVLLVKILETVIKSLNKTLYFNIIYLLKILKNKQKCL